MVANHAHHWRTLHDVDGRLWLVCVDCGLSLCWTAERDAWEVA